MVGYVSFVTVFRFIDTRLVAYLFHLLPQLVAGNALSGCCRMKCGIFTHDSRKSDFVSAEMNKGLSTLLGAHECS